MLYDGLMSVMCVTAHASVEGYVPKVVGKATLCDFEACMRDSITLALFVLGLPQWRSRRAEHQTS